MKTNDEYGLFLAIVIFMGLPVHQLIHVTLILIVLFFNQCGIYKIKSFHNNSNENNVNDVNDTHKSDETKDRKRFIHVGIGSSETLYEDQPSNYQFSDDQIENIALNYDIFNMAKFHAGWNCQKQIEEIKRIKSKASELHRQISINAYYSLSLVFWLKEPEKFEFYYGVKRKIFDENWLLHEKNNPEPNYKPRILYLDDENTAFADLSNSKYRKWVFKILSQWKSAAPYDGIFFDNSRPLGEYLGNFPKTKGLEPLVLSGYNTKWVTLIGDEKVKNYNLGIKELFQEAKKIFKTVTYNGIGRRYWMPDDNKRNLKLLDEVSLGGTDADGVLNEGFCFDREKVKSETHY